MLYENSDPQAVIAMERARTGGYGEYDSYGAYVGYEIPGDYNGYSDDSEMKCPCCGAENPDMFYINDDDECVGCSSCVYASDILY